MILAYAVATGIRHNVAFMRAIMVPIRRNHASVINPWRTDHDRLQQVASISVVACACNNTFNAVLTPLQSSVTEIPTSFGFCAFALYRKIPGE